MLCTDTSGKLPAVKLPIPIDLARDIASMLLSIDQLGGNGDLTLQVRGNNVEGIETVVKQSRKRKKS